MAPHRRGDPLRVVGMPGVRGAPTANMTIAGRGPRPGGAAGDGLEVALARLTTRLDRIAPGRTLAWMTGPAPPAGRSTVPLGRSRLAPLGGGIQAAPTAPPAAPLPLGPCSLPIRRARSPCRSILPVSRASAKAGPRAGSVVPGPGA
jgi:hypothetical protein